MRCAVAPFFCGVKMTRRNEWTVSGEIIYIKVFDNPSEYYASIKIRGTVPNTNGILEFGCIMRKSTYDMALEMGMDKFVNATVTGYFETWIKQGAKGDRVNVRNVCEGIVIE